MTQLQSFSRCVWFESFSKENGDVYPKNEAIQIVSKPKQIDNTS